MTDSDRCVLAAVPKLTFGPESDLFCCALRIALQYLGHSEIGYHSLVGWSGRGFKICWSDRMFFWDRHLERADPDAEQYLRVDFAGAVDTVAATGYEGRFVANAACRHPISAAGVEPGDGGTVRSLVLDSIREGRPVLAMLSLTTEPWAPEWSLITGFDDGGDNLVGWSCLQNEDHNRAELQTEADGAFRLANWESGTVVAVRLCGSRQQTDTAALERHAVERGIRYARGLEEGPNTWGVSSYEAWARALEAEDLASVDDHVLRGRMQYHVHYVGHLAAQRWYTSTFLKEMAAPVFSVSQVLSVASCYARIHELMWDCWQVAGGYWRVEDVELPRFRDPSARAEIAGIIRAAGRQDSCALEHMEAALASWDKTHRYYIGS